MALAYLKFMDAADGSVSFEADTGTNEFYALQFGRQRIKRDGLELIDELVFETPLAKSGSSSPFRSAFEVRVPAENLNGTIRFAQLLSFKDQRRTSPAFSRVVAVYPPVNFQDTHVQLSTMKKNTYPGAFCRTVSFSFREPAFSTAMFWQALLEVAKVIVPGAAGSFVNAINPGQAQGANNEIIVNLLNAVMAALQKGGLPGPSVNGHVPVGQAQNFNARLRPPVNHTGKWNGKKISRQQAVPLLALLPLLQPLLQNLPQLIGPLVEKSPQLLQILADAPNRFINAINEKDRIALEGQKADQQHHENLLRTAMQDSGSLQELLANLTNLSKPVAEVPPPKAAAQSAYARLFSQAVKKTSTMIFQQEDPVVINGKPKYVYASGGRIKFMIQLSIAGEKVLSKAILRLTVKDPDTKRDLFEKNFQLKNIPATSLQELTLEADEVARLTIGKDLMVYSSLRYLDTRNKPAEVRGGMQLIFLTGAYMFKRIGSAVSGSIPLTDRNQFRMYWNKIWEGGGVREKKKWEVTFNVKYYLYYRYDQGTNGRVETRILQAESDDASARRSKVEGKLKSGLEISPDALNKLLPLISTYPELDPEKLRAFKTDELCRDYNSEALISLELKGGKDETGMLWTYPEIGLFEFTLNRISRVNEAGQVMAVEEEQVVFPKPVSIHFAGEKTKHVYA